MKKSVARGKSMRKFCRVAAILAAFSACALEGQRIEVTIPAVSGPLTGHLILIFAKTDTPEPRMQINEQYRSAQGFGVDVSDLAPGQPIVVDAQTFGYPRRSLADLDAGDYFVQAVFNVYELFHLADGRNLWLPPDKGRGPALELQTRKPLQQAGEDALRSQVASDPKLALDQVFPPIEGTDRDPEVMARREPGAKWLKYMRFKSDALRGSGGATCTWARGSCCPTASTSIPVRTFRWWSIRITIIRASGPILTELPPDPQVARLARQKTGYKFFQDWTSGRLPRVILIYVQNANPYYDDSYDVDSANVGPYGTAINDELIPAIEKKYRGIGRDGRAQPMAARPADGRRWPRRSFYPDMYNGAYVACPIRWIFTPIRTSISTTTRTLLCAIGDFGEIPIAADRKPDGIDPCELRPGIRL